MKKIISIFLLTALALTIFAGCSGSGTNENEIKIGINYELSGGSATYGQGSVEGIKLAIEQINADGGINGKKMSMTISLSLLRLLLLLQG